MRIDPNPGTAPLPESGRSGNQTPNALPASSGSASALGEDQAQLSGAGAQLQALVAQASQLPETAAAKIDALRQAVMSGSYQPSPDQVAGALFAHMVVQLAA